MNPGRSGAVGTAVGVGAVLAGSPTFVIVRMLEHHNAFQQVLCRSPFFLGVALSVAAARWKCGGGEAMAAACKFGWIGFAGSFFLAAQSLAIVVSLLLTKMSNVAFIINTSPVFCGLIDTFVLRESVPLRTKCMMAMGLVCVTIILAGDFDGNPHYTAGNIVALVNPISWAIFWAIMRHKKKQTVNTVAVVESSAEKWDNLIFVQLASGSIVAIAGAIGTLATPDLFWSRRNTTAMTTPGSMDANDWWMYALYGGVVLPITVLLFSAAPMYISTTWMGCIKQLEMVLIPIYGYLYDGEVPHTQAVVGASLLVLTLLVHSFFQFREDGILE